jgi:hypothetical protein
MRASNAARSRLNEATASTLLSQLAFGSDAVQGVRSRQEARKAAYGGEERKKEFSGDTPVPPAEGRGPLHSCFLRGCQA